MAATSSKEVTDGKHHSLRGIFFIMLGSFSFSTMFLLVKVMSQMNTFTLVFYRSIVQIGICLVDLYKKRVNPLGPDCGTVRFYLVLRAGFGAAAVIAWFYGIQNLPLPDAVTLQFTTPPFAAVFAVCLVGEHWKALDMIGAIVCLMGVALIAHPTWLFGSTVADEAVLVTDDTDSSTMMKAVAVLVTEAGAAMAGIAYVCVRKIGNRADAVVMVFYYGVISLPMTALGSKMLLGTWNVLGNYEQFSLLDYFLLLLVGFAGYGGQWFTNLGLQQETAATATLATSSQIVFTFMFEILFLHEEIDVWSLSGTALILGFMMVVGVIKLIESDKNKNAIIETDEEKGLLLEPSKENEGYGAAITLQSQGSNSF